jgi:hypothetical protein
MVRLAKLPEIQFIAMACSVGRLLSDELERI